MEWGGIGSSASTEAAMAAARHRSKSMIKLRFQERDSRNREASGVWKIYGDLKHQLHPGQNKQR